TKIGEGVQLVFLGDLSAITAALSRGEIDGFAWVPSVHWRLEGEGKAKVIFYYKDYGTGALWHERVVVTRNDVIRERPELVSRFVRFYRDLIKTYELEREYVTSLMASPPPKGFGFSKELAERWYLFYRPNHLGAPIREALVGARDLALASGVTKETPPIEQWYTTAFL
ncbi:MAG: ABC transporter substrate-binding protein, partial [Nitrososphaerota archaeon]